MDDMVAAAIRRLVRTRNRGNDAPAGTPHVVVSAQTKGGTGKTTVSAGLFGAALACGVRAELIDADTEQQSVMTWLGKQGDPRVMAMEPKDVGRYAAGADADLLIVDTAGRETADNQRLFGIADLVLIPMTDSGLDTRPAALLCGRLTKASIPAMIVFSAMDRPDGVRMRRAAGEFVGRYRCPTVIPRRVAVKDAVRLGLRLDEYSPAVAVHGAFVELLIELAERIK